MSIIRLTLISILFICMWSVLKAEDAGLIPMPLRVKSHSNEVFEFTPKTGFVCRAGILQDEIRELQAVLKKRLGLEVKAATKIGKGNITFLLDEQMKGIEAYRLKVDSKGITVIASTPAGIFYGIKTLDQLLISETVPGKLRGVEIEDAPRYSYRALMLDPARTFIPVKDVKRYIDRMSMYKLNTLHLHLSDDQGWRVEIKKYPKLTEIGAVRKETDGDGKEHRGFYTQDELKDLVAYARKKQVEIIPEIDVPGHSVAAIAAYPFLTCLNPGIGVRTTAGVSTDLLCAGNEEVYAFYADVIDELCAIFPADKFHIGGDEAPLDNWKKCEKCRQLMKTKGFDREQQLMSYFFTRINGTLVKHGKTPLVWYELDVPEYPRNSIMYAWRWGLTPKVIEAARKSGHQVICAPGEHAYFDYPQRAGDMPEVNWGMPVIPLKKAYDFDPGYGLPAEQQGHILGVEATLWGECIRDIDRAFYMTYPRALALAEAGWSMMENRNWESFLTRMYPNLDDMMKDGVNFRVPFEVTGH